MTRHARRCTIIADRCSPPVHGRSPGSAYDAQRRALAAQPAGAGQFYPAEWLLESVTIAERCTFTLDELRYQSTRKRLCRRGETLASYLEQPIPGAASHGRLSPMQRVVALRTGNSLIAELRYEAYFPDRPHGLSVRFVRSRRDSVPGPRLGAANSAVC